MRSLRTANTFGSFTFEAQFDSTISNMLMASQCLNMAKWSIRGFQTWYSMSSQRRACLVSQNRNPSHCSKALILLVAHTTREKSTCRCLQIRSYARSSKRGQKDTGGETNKSSRALQAVQEDAGFASAFGSCQGPPLRMGALHEQR